MKPLAIAALIALAAAPAGADGPVAATAEPTGQAVRLDPDAPLGGSVNPSIIVSLVVVALIAAAVNTDD